MSSINPSRNSQGDVPQGRPPLKRQQGVRGLRLHTVVSLGSSEPSEQEPSSTARKTTEVVQDKFPSNISQGGGGGGKATPPSSQKDLPQASLQSRSISPIDDGLDRDSGDESKADSTRPPFTTRRASTIGRSVLSIFNSGDEEKSPTLSSKKGEGGASKMGEQFTFPEIEIDEGEYAPSSFASRGFDLEFQGKVKAALKDCYQSIDRIKTVFSQKQAAKDAEEDFQSRLANILRMDYDSSKKIEGLQPSQALKQEALNSVNNEILLNLVAKLVDNRDELSPIVKTILIECNYAVLGEEGVYLAAAKPQEFLIFSEAFNEAKKQLDICRDLFEVVSRELASKGCPEEGIQSWLSDFIKGFEFTPRKSLFTTAEIKQFINQILALDKTRREEAKEEARTTLISKGMNPKVIEYGIKQLFLTRYKDKFAPAPSGSDLTSKVESFIKEEYAKLVNPLFQQFDPKYYSSDVVKLFIDRVMEAHIEETSLILEEKGIKGLRQFVKTKVQRDLVVIAHFYKDAQKILVEELSRAGWKKEVVNSFFNKVFKANLDEAKLDQVKLNEMETILKSWRRFGGSELQDFVNRTIKPNVESLLEGIPKEYSHTKIFSKIVEYLAGDFKGEGWDYKAALSTLNVVFEKHMEEIKLIWDSKEDLESFIRTKVIPEVEGILQNLPNYLTLRAQILARECEKEGWDYEVALKIVESVMNEPFMRIQIKATIKNNGSLNSMIKKEVKPQVMGRLRKISKVSPPDKKPKI